MLQWNERFATGFHSVDLQHQELFKMVNGLETSIREGKAKEAFAETLTFLGNYVQKHFNEEEACMHAVNCPSAQQNEEAHKEFLSVYGGFVSRFNKEGYTDAMARELHDTAQKWLVKHICSIDNRLKFCKQ